MAGASCWWVADWWMAGGGAAAAAGAQPRLTNVAAWWCRSVVASFTYRADASGRRMQDEQNDPEEKKPNFEDFYF